MLTNPDSAIFPWGSHAGGMIRGLDLNKTWLTRRSSNQAAIMA
jgi:hypothetical protein